MAEQSVAFARVLWSRRCLGLEDQAPAGRLLERCCGMSFLDSYCELESVAMAGLPLSAEKVARVAELVRSNGLTKYLPAMAKGLGKLLRYKPIERFEALAMIELLKDAPDLTEAEIEKRIADFFEKAGICRSWLAHRFVPALRGEVEAKRRTERKPRRKVSTRKDTPLTSRQLEALQLVGEHKGNKAAAARAAGVSPTAMKKLYRKALAKAPQAAMPKPKFRNLPHDKRGQVNIGG